MVLLPCSKCCRPCLSAEDYYNLEAEFELLEYYNELTEIGRNMDKTADSGLPVGTKILTTDGYDFDIPGSGPGWEDPESAVWSIYGYYSAPQAIECGTNFDGSVSIAPKINPRVTFYKNDEVEFCNQMRAGIGFEYPPEQWSDAVKNQSLTYDEGSNKKCIGYTASGGSIKEFELGVPYVFTSSVRDSSGNRQVSLRWQVIIQKKTTRSRTMPTTTGPGTHLKNMLGWVGIRATEKGCKCRHWEKKMNQGPQWCRDHKQEILDHLEKEAKKRGLPFVKLAASKLVDLAIRRAERGQ